MDEKDKNLLSKSLWSGKKQPPIKRDKERVRSNEEERWEKRERDRERETTLKMDE